MPSHRLILTFMIFCTTIQIQNAFAVTLLVSSEATNTVKRYDPITGAFLGDFVASGSGGLASPEGLAYGVDGNLYVSSFGSNSILRYDGSTGQFLGVFSNAVSRPAELQFGPNGNLYVVNSGNDTVTRYDPTSGSLLGTIGNSALLNTPRGLAFGPDGLLYVSSNANDAITLFNLSTDAFVGFLESGGSNNMKYEDLVFGPDRFLYVSVSGLNVVRGGFSAAFTGGGLQHPVGLLFDEQGRIYVSSFGNDSIILFGGNFQGGPITADVVVSEGTGGLQHPTFLTFGPDPLSQVVPEPSSVDLFGLGCLALLVLRAHLCAKGAPRVKKGTG